MQRDRPEIVRGVQGRPGCDLDRAARRRRDELVSNRAGVRVPEAAAVRRRDPLELHQVPGGQGREGAAAVLPRFAVRAGHGG